MNLRTSVVQPPRMHARALSASNPSPSKHWHESIVLVRGDSKELTALHWFSPSNSQTPKSARGDQAPAGPRSPTRISRTPGHCRFQACALSRLHSAPRKRPPYAPRRGLQASACFGASTAPPGSTRSTRRPSSPANAKSVSWEFAQDCAASFRACDMESNRNGVSSS